MHEVQQRSYLKKTRTMTGFTGEEMSGKLFGFIISIAALMTLGLVLVATELS